MKKTIILLLFIIQLSNTFGIDKDISLIWKDNDKTKQNSLPLFTGAKLNEQGIPIYIEILPDNGEPYQLQVISTELVSEELIVNKQIKRFIGQSFEFKQEQYNQRKQPYRCITVCPYRINKATGAVERITAFSIIKGNSAQAILKNSSVKKRAYATSSVLKTGKWFKIQIDQTGIQKLSYSQLKEIGISDPGNVRVFGNGGKKLPTLNSSEHPDDLNEIPTQIVSQTGNFKDGDYVLFYAEKAQTWQYDYTKKLFKHQKHPFSTSAYCFLTSDLGKGKSVQINTEPNSTANQNVTSFDDYAFSENDTRNLLKSGSEWYGEVFNSITTNYSFSFPFTNIISNSGKAYFDAIARSSSNCSFSILYNNQSIGSTSAESYNTAQNYANDANGIFNFAPNSNNINLQIKFTRQSDPEAQGWLNYIGINVRRSLRMESAALPFRDQNSIGSGNIAQFTIQNVTASTQVWDVTEINNVSQAKSSITSSVLSFKASADSIRQYIAFDPTLDGITPTVKGDGLGLVENQDLHGLQSAQFLIVTHPNFINAAKDLANFKRNNDKLSTNIVTTTQIYNEFSSGMPDVSAIRNFVKMFYDRAASDSDLPRYLLLLGDGSYNNLSTSKTNINYIPSYQSENSLNEGLSFVSDDFFGLLDDNEGDANGLIDIAIGRFPVQTAEKADSMVSKVKRYATTSNFGQWRNQLCFLADDDNNNAHLIQSNRLAEKVKGEHPTFNIEKIFLDAYQQITTSNGQSYPDVNKQFEDRMRKGALIVNYTGHSGVFGLTNENVVNTTTINAYDNYSKLPLFITASCEFGRWDDIDVAENGTCTDKTSAGELIFLNNKGGAIALLTTTRLVESTANFDLNNSFYDYAFQTDLTTNQPNRLGEIARKAKNDNGSTANTRSFTLLGDPSLMLANPAMTNIRTDSLNNKSISEPCDTLKALSKANIIGTVCDANGNPDLGYTGTLTAIIFDKEIICKNLQNEEQDPITFTKQENIIYKGKVSVVKGKFRIEFIVPKDINFSYGFGKISYYTENGTADRTGAYKKTVIGGLSNNTITDTKGPTIKLGLNNPTFVNGAIVSSQPSIYAAIEDNNGINTSGIGIGHDITAILDGNTNDKLILNDYYEADKDSYLKGTIIYPYTTALSEGSHTLKLKVWDVANNSSESTINFIVAKNEDLNIQHVLNYPNPFTTKTSFYFNHNRPSQTLNIQIQIFTVSGKLVKTIRTTGSSTGYISEPIAWDGRDDYGDKIGRGVYIYRLKVKDQDGKTAEKYEKLLILH